MSGPKVLSAQEIKMRAVTEEHLRLVQERIRKTEVLRRKMKEIDDVQLVLSQIAEDPRAQEISSQLTRLADQGRSLCNVSTETASAKNNDRLKKHIDDLDKLTRSLTPQVKSLKKEALTFRDQYVRSLIDADFSSGRYVVETPDRQIIVFAPPAVSDTLIEKEKKRLTKLILNIEERANRIHALKNTDFSSLHGMIRKILGTGSRENHMIYQDLHQFDVCSLQPLLESLEAAEEAYDLLDTELSRELAVYHTVCSEYGIPPQRFPFSVRSVQEIRYATAAIIQEYGQNRSCTELMVRVRKILTNCGYTYIGDKEETRQIFRQIYRIHDQTILHVIYDSSGRVTMEVAIEDDTERAPIGREIEQIISDQDSFCQSFEQIFTELNREGLRMKKDLLCPCGSEFAQIIDTSGFSMIPEAKTEIDYSVFESPETKYSQME